jgi:hypothetical protein
VLQDQRTNIMVEELKRRGVKFLGVGNGLELPPAGTAVHVLVVHKQHMQK